MPALQGEYEYFVTAYQSLAATSEFEVVRL
jgi:hypothetical protein